MKKTKNEEKKQNISELMKDTVFRQKWLNLKTTSIYTQYTYTYIYNIITEQIF